MCLVQWSDRITSDPIESDSNRRIFFFKCEKFKETPAELKKERLFPFSHELLLFQKLPSWWQHRKIIGKVVVCGGASDDDGNSNDNGMQQNYDLNKEFERDI